MRVACAWGRTLQIVDSLSRCIRAAASVCILAAACRMRLNSLKFMQGKQPVYKKRGNVFFRSDQQKVRTVLRRVSAHTSTQLEMRARAVVAKLARLVKAAAVVSLTWGEHIFQWGCCHVLEQLLQEVKASEKDLRARKDAAQMALDSMVTLFSFVIDLRSVARSTTT